MYRFKRVGKNIYGTSILDVACGQADFLTLIKKKYQIAGTEINERRVNYCNQVLGQDSVKFGNLDIGLDFGDNSFDTVTCLEVLEHLNNPQEALKELVRISRKRVIVTVPYDEAIKYVLCIHCAKYTPISAHLHRFNKQKIKDIMPDNVRLVKIDLIGNKALRLFPYLNSIVFRAPLSIISLIDKFANRIFPRASWMLVILDKNNSADNHR